MKRNRSVPDAAVIPVLIYPGVRQAVAWLTGAFGFAERVRIGENHRSRLRSGDGALIVGDVREDRCSPCQGEVTHSVMVRVEDARALRAGPGARSPDPHGADPHGADPHGADPHGAGRHAVGERQYNAGDPFGHQWTFTETLADVAPEEWGGETAGR